MEAVAGPVAHTVVALDGSGHHTTVAAALATAPRRSTKRYTIFVKMGVYKVAEPIIVDKDMWNVALVGEGMNETIISGDRSHDDGYDTDQTGTLTALGQGFIAQDLTIENTTGAAKHQAVALLSESDKSVVHCCAIKGYQDTLYAKHNRQLYTGCRIEGTVDFIFGDAAAVFQKCDIIARQPLEGQQNTITAQGRQNVDDAGGFLFQFCNLDAEPVLIVSAVETYLGRPWRPYSRVVFMKCKMSPVVHPKGWLEWNGSTTVKDFYYREYKNEGPGADVSGCVKWPGYHVIEDESESDKFTVQNLIKGNDWLPATKVNYTPGL